MALKHFSIRESYHECFLGNWQEDLQENYQKAQQEAAEQYQKQNEDRQSESEEHLSSEDESDEEDQEAQMKKNKKNQNVLNPPEFKTKDFKNKVMKYLFSPKEMSFERDLDDIAYTMDQNTFKYWLFLGAFMLIHLERPRTLKRLYDYDSWIRKQIDKILHQYSKYTGDQSKLLKHQASSIVNNARKNETNKSHPSLRSMQSLKKGNVRVDDPEFLMGFQDKKYNIKNILRSQMGKKFASMALKIALIKRQEKICCALLLEYDCRIEKSYLKMGVTGDLYTFLQIMWKKDKIYYTEGDNSASEVNDDQSFVRKSTFKSPNRNDEQDPNALKFTYDEFFNLILKVNPKNGQKKIKEVVDWNLNSPGENMIISLLKVGMENIAISKHKNYDYDIEDELYYFCLHNGNDDFLRYGILSGLFNSLNLFDKDKTIEIYLAYLERGVKLDITLNLLLYSNITKMKAQYVFRLLNVIKRVVTEPNEKNIILHTSNTLLCLALCQEYLINIGKYVHLFRKKCKWITQRLDTLIEKIIFNLDYDMIESIFLSKDFKDRSLIKIVTDLELKSFLKSPKTTILLDTLWEGIASTECDGRLADFSTMNYLLQSKTKKIEGRKISPKDLLTNRFTINIGKVKFWFQNIFRSESIDYLFKKDFL